MGLIPRRDGLTGLCESGDYVQLSQGRSPTAEGVIVRKVLLVLAAAAALAVPASASARVKLVSVTSPASPGSHATLTVAVSPAKSCTIIVMYKSGSSHAQGLYAKRPVNGRVSWTWMVGTNTTAGRWPIFVACGSAGAVQTSFVVR